MVFSMARGMADGMVKDFYVGMQIEEDIVPSFDLPPGARVFSLSPAVSGKSTWDLDVDGPLTLDAAGTWAIVPSGTFNVTTVMWGAGGRLNASFPGGAGGYATAVVLFRDAIAYSAVVGNPGTHEGGVSANGGGGAAGIGGGSGGGYSGILAAGVPVLVAGGGGGGGFGGNGGGGGGSSGENGTAFSLPGSFGYGGSQTAGGARYSAPATAGTALLGGTGATETSNYSGGGGGGGYYGGGGGIYISGEGGASGGGGGSGFADPVDTMTSTLTAAVGTTAGNSGHGSRGTSGNEGVAGKVILS